MRVVTAGRWFEMPVSQMSSRTCGLRPRGPLTSYLFRLLDDRDLPMDPREIPITDPVAADDPLDGDDFHLALYACYELSYRGLPGVDPGMEWDPAVLDLRRHLEQRFEDALRDACTSSRVTDDASATIVELLQRSAGPSLSTFMEQVGTRHHFREFLVHRSAYQLKEADPHTWAIPRLPSGARKSALIEVQADEYGNGEPGATHAELYSAAMRSAGLDSRYGAHVDHLPGSTLATCNLVSMFGLRRELTAALLGHLAVFEMTSVAPMSRYSRAAARLGFGAEVQRFYDVHVEADEHHGDLARSVLIGGDLKADGFDPADVVFGAEALLRVEDRFTRHLLSTWRYGHSSLGPPTHRWHSEN
jgi:hypothetical protein